MHFDYSLPVRVKFGLGSVDSLGEECRQIGRKVLIVTGRNSARQSGILARVESLLQAAGMERFIFDQVTPNPLYTMADDGAAVAREKGCDLVIGLGGGSSMDTAKAVAVGAVNPGSVWDYVARRDQEYRPVAAALPVVMVVTNAGTGSEINHSAVLTDPRTGEKPSITSHLIYSRLSIVDPGLMTGVPARVTAESGLDIFFQALEGYVNLTANPLSRLLAGEAMRLVLAHLPAAYRDGGDLEARTQIALASVVGGMSNDLAASVLLHALEHPVSGFYNAPHGSGLAALFRPVFQFNLDYCAPELAQVYRLLSGSGGELPGRAAAQACLDLVTELIRAVDQGCTLTDWGAREEDFPEMARQALSTMAGGVANNPRPVSLEEMISLYRQAM